VSRSRFTRRQRLVLALMSVAIVVVFGLLGFSVVVTMRQMSPTTPSALSNLSPLRTPVTTTTIAPTITPPPTATRPVPLSQLQNARAVREIGAIVAEVRDLPLVEQIPVTFPTEHEMAIFLLQQYQEEQPQQVLNLYAALGIISPLEPPPLPDAAAQAAQISSLYLPVGRQIMMVAGRGPASPDDELELVRALAHALQDQEFGLENLVPCEPTFDAAMALQALVEGDSVLTTALYGGLESDPEEVDRLAQTAADAEEPAYAPLAENTVFAQLRLFPYREGARLAAALYAEGGWREVNRAYARPPCSTEQVLHPERYLEGEPVETVTLPDLGPSLGEGWVLTRSETLGELLVGLHLAAYLEDDGKAWDGADGWAGDTFRLWQDEEGEQLLVWRIAWDDLAEAKDFEQTYALVPPRFRVPPLIAAETPFGLPGRFWEGPAGAAYLTRAGRVVTVVWGPDAERVAAAAQALP